MFLLREEWTVQEIASVFNVEENFINKIRRIGSELICSVYI